MPGILALTLLGCVAMLASTPAYACTGALHIEVGPSGVYSLEHADAAAAQPGLSGCPVDALTLHNRGKVVPVRVIDDGNGVFDGDDRIEWLGQRLHGPQSWADTYSNVNVYVLNASGNGSRLSVVPPPLKPGHAAELARTMHLEQPTMMIRLSTDQVEPGTEPDVWYWSKMTMIDPNPFSTSFDLPGLRNQHDDLSLRLAFRGLSSVRPHKGQPQPVDHRVVVLLNGTELAVLEWSGEGHITRTLPLPHGVLRASDNTLSMSVPKRMPPWSDTDPIVDVVMFDFLELAYPIRANIGEQRAPIRVEASGSIHLRAPAKAKLYGSNGQIYLPRAKDDHYAYARVPAGTVLYPLAAEQTPLAPGGLRAIADSDWRQPGQAYDYVMIAHPSLLDATRPLAEFHRRRGLEVALINVNEVYDQFNHGIVNPDAIHDLLEYAHRYWPRPRPRFVLLVGDASFDIHDQLRHQKYYSKWTDRELLFPGQFGIIPGTPYQNLPQTPADRNLIPTYQYYASEGQSASDNGFVDFDPESTHPSMAIGRFPVITPAEVSAIVNKTINYMRNPRMGAWRQSVMFITNDSVGFQQQSNQLAVALGEYGFTADKVYPSETDKDNALHQQKIMQEINSGELLVHFLGHGGRYIWRTGPPDPRKNHDLFTLDNVEALNNAGRLPMVLSMTCYSAPFDNPTEDSIGERFLREPDSGAIAVFAASWRNAPDAAFSKTLLQQLVQPGVRIGDAIMQAKNETDNRAMIGMYNLLGDPALALQRPREQLNIVQTNARWSPGIKVEVPGAAQFHGSMRVEWLDAEHKVLSHRTYQVDSPRLLLPPPPEGAHEVRVYALDPSRASDALGQLTLKERKPSPSWWATAFAAEPEPTPLRPAPDRVFGANFGG